jgi:hypothetical protein
MKFLAPKSKKPIGPDETRKHLEMLLHKSFDPAVFDGMQLDKREVARFLAEKVRILRLASIAGGLRELTWMIENAYYEAYTAGQTNKSEGLEFSSPPQNLQ